MPSLRTLLYLPLGLSVLLYAAYLLVSGEANSLSAGILFGTLALLLAVTAVVTELLVLRPLRALMQGMDNLALGNFSSLPSKRGFGELRTLTANVEQLRLMGQERDTQLSEESSRRQKMEEALREYQERYVLAVRGANDGMWEWDLKTDSASFSPRWKSILGFTEQEISNHIDEWRQRIHPDDRAPTLANLRAHLAGDAACFENEHRLRHKDGGYRWILARGTALRHANGNPYRVVGLHTDITARKQVQETVLELAEGLSSAQGEESLRSLVKNCASILGVGGAFVSECCDYPTTRVRMLAHWQAGQFTDCMEYDLAGTTCEEVIQQGKVLHCPQGVGERWPQEKLFGVESYLGIPCLDTTGRVIGHIACTDGKPMRTELPHQAIIKIFSLRASVELERRLLLRERHQIELQAYPKQEASYT